MIQILLKCFTSNTGMLHKRMSEIYGVVTAMCSAAKNVSTTEVRVIPKKLPPHALDMWKIIVFIMIKK